MTGPFKLTQHFNALLMSRWRLSILNSLPGSQNYFSKWTESAVRGDKKVRIARAAALSKK